MRTPRDQEEPWETSPCRVGEVVWDDLMRSEATVVGMDYSKGKTPQGNHIGSWGIWLDNDWLGGGRHPWEITRLKEI